MKLKKPNPHMTLTEMRKMTKAELRKNIRNPIAQVEYLRKNTLIDILNAELNQAWKQANRGEGGNKMDTWECLDCNHTLSDEELEKQLDKEEDVECPVCERTSIDLLTK